MLVRPDLTTATHRLMAWACAILVGLMAWTALILGIIALL
jgi:hypothetical protein